MAIPKRLYWLREVVMEDGTSYHISFRDGQRKTQDLCVSYDFYMAFRRLELDERKLESWDYRHREFSEIMEQTLNWRALQLPKSIEELILEEERAELLQRAIHYPCKRESKSTDEKISGGLNKIVVHRAY